VTGAAATARALRLRLTRPGTGAQATPRSLRANAGLALAGDLFTKASAFLTVAVVARVLPTPELALLGVCMALMSILGSALDAGSSVLITRDGAGDGRRAGALMRASLLGRLPLVAVALAGAVVVGEVVGRPVEALVTLAGAIVSAAALSLLACFRAGQDLAVEARQKLASAALSVVGALALAAWRPTGLSVLVALALAPVLTIPALAWRAPRAAGPSAGFALETVRRASPLALLALATLVYYRAPTVLLGAWRPAADTAAFTVASTLAFGLLALPNAITTGLLPRLSSIADPRQRLAGARTALRWTLHACMLSAALVIAVAPWALALAFGARYAHAATPLSLLLVGDVLIGVSGVIGTLLLAERRIRPLCWQVAGSLAVNLVCAAILIPRAGAAGAAVATVVTELVALGMLGAAVRRELPALLGRTGPRAWSFGAAAAVCLTAAAAAGGATRPALGAAAGGLAIAADGAVTRRAWQGAAAVARRIGPLRAGVFAGLGGLAGLWAWATATGYGLRVISDSPTFLVIVRALARHPLQPVSPFLASGDVETSHATPYTQALGLLWRWFGHDDLASPYVVSPLRLATFLAICGLAVTAVVLHAVFVFVRSQAGSRAAWISIPVLLLLFGPAHVIWAGDMSFHSVLYASYFPQGLALAFALYALVVLDGDGTVRLVGGTLLVAATMSVHPFTGLVLVGLLAARASVAAWRVAPGWWRGPAAQTVGFALASLWPAYSLDRALGESGLSGVGVIALGLALPAVAEMIGPVVGRRSAPAAVGRAGAAVAGALRGRLPLALALLGTCVVAALIAWQAFLLTQPNPDPLIHSNRLAVYWVEDRWRWLLMFSAGAVGLVGLARLARRGRPLAAWWFAGAFAIGAAGVAGAPLPVWWRFLLMGQVPLAVGVATVLAERPGPAVRRLTVAGFTASGLFKLMLLLAVAPSLTYFGTPLQSSWSLGQIIPRQPGIVASDPFTSYLVPPTSGHKVLVVTKAHVNSARELADSEAGYRLLLRFAHGGDWWPAAQAMYRRGVRYVLIQHSILLTAPDLETFSTGPTPLIRTPRDRQAIGVYFHRANRVGELIYDQGDYALYRFVPAKLFPRPSPPAAVAGRGRPQSGA